MALLTAGPLVAGTSSAARQAADPGVLVVAKVGAGPADTVTRQVATAKLATTRSTPSPAQRLDALLAQIAETQARLDAAEAEVVSLTARRSQVGPEITAAIARRSAASAALKAAAKEVSSAGKEETQAKTAQDTTVAAHTAATAEFDAAGQVDEAARTRREDVTGQADEARSAVKRAAAKVDKARGKAYAPAFTAWQMAAIADRVGQARVVRAKQRGVRRGPVVSRRQTRRCPLHRPPAPKPRIEWPAQPRRPRTPTSASTAARVERAAAREQLAALRAEKPRVLVALAKATSQAQRLRGELAVLIKRVAKARAEVARAGTSTPKATP